MRWYTTSKECVALRKHMLRVDMRVYVGNEDAYQNENDLLNAIKSIITAAIIKGLDVVGFVSVHGPQLGYKALEIAKNQGVDLYVIPAEEYHTNDKGQLVIYGLKEAMPMNLSTEQAVKHAHKEGGFVMVINVGKRLAQHLNTLKNTDAAPDAVEIYNGVTGGYQDIEVDYPKFISTGAVSANELEKSNVFTLINRKELEGMGLLPENEGSEYIPGYLKRDDEIQQRIYEEQQKQPTTPHNPTPGGQ